MSDDVYQITYAFGTFHGNSEYFVIEVVDDKIDGDGLFCNCLG